MDHGLRFNEREKSCDSRLPYIDIYRLLGMQKERLLQLNRPVKVVKMAYKAISNVNNTINFIYRYRGVSTVISTNEKGRK